MGFDWDFVADTFELWSSAKIDLQPTREPLVFYVLCGLAVVNIVASYIPANHAALVFFRGSIAACVKSWTITCR